MRRLFISDPGIMSLAVQQEIARSEESRYDHRLHGILLVSRGLSCYQAADWLGQDSRTVQRWVKRFEARGFAGLREGQRPGRPSQLSPQQWDVVDGQLRQDPRQLGYRQNLWDGRLLAHHLAKTQGIHLGVRQCQRLFHQLGFRLRKPRPVIAQADPWAQAVFKKTPGAGRRRRSGPVESG
jgi:transposase